MLGLLGGQEKGSEGYKGDGISIKDGMVEPCPVRSNHGSYWGFGGGTFGRHREERTFMQLQQEAIVRFGFSDLDPEDLTSNGGSWLLGRRRLGGKRPGKDQVAREGARARRFRGR